MVVHCSAGVGGTGTVTFCDHLSETRTGQRGKREGKDEIARNKFQDVRSIDRSIVRSLDRGRLLGDIIDRKQYLFVRLILIDRLLRNAYVS